MVDLGLDGVIASGVDFNTWNDIRSGRQCVLGRAIPVSLFTSEPEELQGYVEKNRKGNVERGVFITTDWEVMADTPPDAIHFFMKMISQG